MARPKRKRKERAERLHREPIVREVARILEAGTPTKFRYESACRHGLRAGFCMDGLKWEAADQRARQIVTLALHRIGASLRPTWSIGQPQRDGNREYFYCRLCQGFIPEGNDRPWCSNECREALHMADWKSARRSDDAARQTAIRTVLTGGAEPAPVRVERACKGCGKAYLPKEKHQRFCTQLCATHHISTTKFKESQPCAICATPFMAASNALYCSAVCIGEAHRRQHKAARAERRVWHTLTCVICSGTFSSNWSIRVYCGLECVAEAGRRKVRARRAARREAGLAEAA